MKAMDKVAALKKERPMYKFLARKRRAKKEVLEDMIRDAKSKVKANPPTVEGNACSHAVLPLHCTVPGRATLLGVAR